MNKSVSEARAPDFYQYDANPLSSALCEGDFVHLRWPDDTTLACHRYWLRENSVGQGGIDIATREGLLDPAHLTDDMRYMCSGFADSKLFAYAEDRCQLICQRCLDLAIDKGIIFLMNSASLRVANDYKGAAKLCQHRT